MEDNEHILKTKAQGNNQNYKMLVELLNQQILNSQL